jgi:hypothetical protein
MGRIAPLAAAFAALGALLAPAASAAPRDADRDGLPDRWEKRHRLSTKAKSANGDADRDRVDNANEWREGTSPRDADSDGDRRRDGAEDADRDRLSNAAEDATGNDPKDRDSDDDGIADGGELPGTVLSFSGGVLRVALARGGRVSGMVTPGTELDCEAEREAERGWLRVPRAGAAQEEDPEDYEEPLDDYDDYEDIDDLDEIDFEDDFGEDEDEGDDAGSGDEDDSRAGSCPRGVLRAGARIREAELEVTPDGAFFLELSLIR